jgi:hypothetical protein
LAGKYCLALCHCKKQGFALLKKTEKKLSAQKAKKAIAS